MRALVLEEFNGPLVMKDVPTPEIGPQEALVRVRNVGVCGTDLKIRAGRLGLDTLPLILGHEVAGEIAEVGSQVRGFVPGDRVTVGFYITCGVCEYCREGRDTLCPDLERQGFTVDGGLADYMKVPGSNLCKVPDNVPLEQACILGDAVSTSFHAVTKRARVKPGETVAVVGTGGVGLHALQMAKLAGARTIAIDVNEARMALARELGADEVIDAKRGPFHEEVKRMTGGQGVDALLEFVSTNDTLPYSFQSLKRAGRLVFVGYQPDIGLQVMPFDMVHQELEILGSRATTMQEIQETMNLVSQGRIRAVVDRVFSFEDVESAFDELRAGNILGRNVIAI